MKKAIDNAVVNRAKPAKVHARLAKVVSVKRSYSKVARHAAFIRLANHLPVAEAVSRAKLISEVNPAKFRIIRMPG